jgi:hypothetical protein
VWTSSCEAAMSRRTRGARLRCKLRGDAGKKSWRCGFEGRAWAQPRLASAGSDST